MKKIIIVTLLIAVLCFTMTGCGTNQPNKKTENMGSGNYEYTDSDELEIKKPVVDWWKLYKDINKTNCVTLQVSNPNSFPIQFTYDLVFYKNNEVVKTESHWAMTGLEHSEPGIIYGDIKIPSSSDVDKVELENVEVSKFEEKVLKATYKKSYIDNQVQYFDVTFSGKPEYTEVWVALYNDTNKDKKVQASEFIQMGLLAPFVGIYETKGEIYIPISDEILTFTDYKIYSFAFTRKK